MCIYTMSVHTLYLVSDLEGSENSDPLYGIMQDLLQCCHGSCVFITAGPITKLFAGGVYY
jgi:hypothetical protein